MEECFPHWQQSLRLLETTGQIAMKCWIILNGFSDNDLLSNATIRSELALGHNFGPWCSV